MFNNNIKNLFIYLACSDSEFGCCPDNSTIALDNFLKGCSNCSVSKFGCCSDNFTYATGLNKKGCLEYADLEESSGEIEET